MTKAADHIANFLQMQAVTTIISEEAKKYPSPPEYPKTNDTLDFATGKVKSKRPGLC
ncbi:MAG: hypothetical protein WDM86_18810 [Rhizomicrobium sp.]